MIKHKIVKKREKFIHYEEEIDKFIYQFCSLNTNLSGLLEKKISTFRNYPHMHPSLPHPHLVFNVTLNRKKYEVCFN